MNVEMRSPASLESQTIPSSAPSQGGVVSSTWNGINRKVSQALDCLPTSGQVQVATIKGLTVLGALTVIVGPTVGFSFGAHKCLNDPNADQSKWCTTGKNGQTYTPEQGAAAYIIGAVVWSGVTSAAAGAFAYLYCRQ